MKAVFKVLPVLCLSGFIFISQIVSAQTAPAGGSLFPELKKSNPDQYAAGAALPEQTVGNKVTSNKIVLSLSDIQMVVPAAKRMQFCFATLNIQNNMDQAIDRLDVTLTYAPLEYLVQFFSVGKGGTQTTDIVMAGSGCDSLLSVPGMKVDVCQGEGLSPEICQSRLRYEPVQ